MKGAALLLVALALATPAIAQNAVLGVNVRRVEVLASGDPNLVTHS